MFAMSDLQRSESWANLTDHGYEIEISEQTVGLLGAGAEADAATISGVVNRVVNEIRDHLGRAAPPLDFDVAPYARVRIAPKLQSALFGPAFAPESELRRILQKHLKDAGSQLHPSYPGILVIQTSSVLDAMMTRTTVEPL